MHIVQARLNMVNNQIRPWDVFNPEIISLFETTAREHFLPAYFKNLAYVDELLPLSNGHHMLPPREQARLLQALMVQPSDRVLEIGTGTGYLTSMFARLSHSVVTVDICKDHSEAAAQRLAALGIGNINFRTGDASQGWTQDGAFDVIALLGAVETLAPAYLTQLTVGGRLFAIIGKAPAMQATLITRLSEQDWRYTVLFESVVPYLVNGCMKAEFVF